MAATAVPGELHTSEVLPVTPFERIDLRDHVNWVDLIAEPGERELLVVEGPSSMLPRVHAVVEGDTLHITLSASIANHVRDAFTTSLTRHHLVYRVRVPRLLEVRVAGMVRVAVHAFAENAPVVTRMEPSTPQVTLPPR
jgi:hypothetical protein